MSKISPFIYFVLAVISLPYAWATIILALLFFLGAAYSLISTIPIAKEFAIPRDTTAISDCNTIYYAVQASSASVIFLASIVCTVWIAGAIYLQHWLIYLGTGRAVAWLFQTLYLRHLVSRYSETYGS